MNIWDSCKIGVVEVGLDKSSGFTELQQYNLGTGWVAGFCETITSSASAKARDEARAELGKIR